MHEDIRPHWMGFLYADSLLASDRIAAIHHVVRGGSRLTNRRGRERLRVFDALRDVQGQLARADPPRDLLHLGFVRFGMGLLEWVRGNLEPRWHSELERTQYAFWQDSLTPELRAALQASAPDLAERLQAQAGPS